MLYPNKTQTEQFNKLLGCDRKKTAKEKKSQK